MMCCCYQTWEHWHSAVTQYVLLKLPDVSICDVAAVTHISNSALIPHQHRNRLLVCYLYCLYKNSLRFSQYKMIKAEKVRGMNFITKLQEQWRICTAAASLADHSRCCYIMCICGGSWTEDSREEVPGNMTISLWEKDAHMKENGHTNLKMN